MKFVVLTIISILLFAANLFFGAIHIPAGDVAGILFGRGEVDQALRFIVLDSRLPQAITAFLAGAGLAISGLMLQTAFRNPLAGPSILGISSGASLGVALVMLISGSGDRREYDNWRICCCCWRSIGRKPRYNGTPHSNIKRGEKQSAGADRRNNDRLPHIVCGHSSIICNNGRRIARVRLLGNGVVFRCPGAATTMVHIADSRWYRYVAPACQATQHSSSWR